MWYHPSADEWGKYVPYVQVQVEDLKDFQMLPPYLQFGTVAVLV